MHRTVVIVDDSPSIVETVALILEMEGFEVHTAFDGLEGLELVRRVRPDAVLLDGMMPELDGFEVCRRIRSDAGLAGTRIVMLTALGQDEHRKRALDAGADRFLAKPFHHEEPLKTLEELFSS